MKLRPAGETSMEFIWLIVTRDKMIFGIKVNDFKGVPYLETSQLMTEAEGQLIFSTTKPNVIVGPNGAGKSSLMKTLAMHTLSYELGYSNFDAKVVRDLDYDDMWQSTIWGQKWEYMPGCNVTSDMGPALYYEPSVIPGHDTSIAAAMMCGYFDQAKAYGGLIKNKSSGQGSMAVLQRITECLRGQPTSNAFTYENWSFGVDPIELDRDRYIGPWDYKAEVLKKLYGHHGAETKMTVLLDEPERSLDAINEINLWKLIQGADSSKVQIIVATHSLYPFMNSDKFHIIEAVPNYVRDVKKVLGLL